MRILHKMITSLYIIWSNVCFYIMVIQSLYQNGIVTWKRDCFLNVSHHQMESIRKCCWINGMASDCWKKLLQNCFHWMMNCDWGLNVVRRCKLSGLFTFYRWGESIQWFIARIWAIVQWWCGRFGVEWRWIGYRLSATFVVDKWFNKCACMVRVIVWCHRWIAMIWFTVDRQASKIIGAIWWIWGNHTGIASFIASVISKAIVRQYCVVVQTWQW